MPTIPDYCLAVVLGPMPEGAFAPEEVVGDPAVAAVRLARRGLCAVRLGPGRSERGGWVALARRHHAPPVALVPPLPDLAPRRARHAAGERVRLLERLPREGFTAVHDLAPGARIDRAPLPCDHRGLLSSFDVIGDVHGHSGTLDALLDELGWSRGRPPPGRRALFVGDLVDRGPDAPGVLARVMTMCARGDALVALGNHDRKLARALAERVPGDRDTMAQMARRPPGFRDAAQAFLEALPAHLWLAGGALVVVHAAIRPEMVGGASTALLGFALHGPTTGRTDAAGRPVREDWVAKHPGRPFVVHGHVPTARPSWRGGVIGIDTGCGIGGPLTALRWPEDELVSVPQGARGRSGCRGS